MNFNKVHERKLGERKPELSIVEEAPDTDKVKFDPTVKVIVQVADCLYLHAKPPLNGLRSKIALALISRVRQSELLDALSGPI